MSEGSKLFGSVEGERKGMKGFQGIVLVSLAVGLLGVPALGKGPKPSGRLGTIGGEIRSDGAVKIGDFTPVSLWLSENLLRVSQTRIEGYRGDWEPGWQTNADNTKPEPTYFPSQYPPSTDDYSLYSGYLRVIVYERQHSVRIDFLFSPCNSCMPPNWFSEDPPVGVDDLSEPIFFPDG